MSRDRKKGAEAPTQGYVAVLMPRVPQPANLPEDVVVKPAPAGLRYHPGFNRDEQMPARDPQTGELIMTRRYIPLLRRVSDRLAEDTGSFRDMQNGVLEVHPYPVEERKQLAAPPTRPGRPRPTVVHANASTFGS